MRPIASWIAGAFVGVAILTGQAGAADLFIADTVTDLGVEPNTGASTTTSPDIWIRRSPDPNYNPAPFNAANPPWTPHPHQNAQHVDPRLSTPNWVYVRVRNRGSGPTPANARLKLYWTKVRGAQNWPTEWVDYFPTPGGVLNGMEITKPRRNAATATQAERNAYIQALLSIDTSSFAFPDGVTYWDKQNQIHSNSVVMSAAHVNPAFLPWHREFLNRYEALLQTVNPTLKLLYWDWQQDPRQPINGFNYFSTNFMGAIGRGTTTPVRAPFTPLMNPVQVVRNSRATGEAFGFRSDASVLARAQYHDVTGSNGLRTFIESGSYHNRAHVDVGGSQPSTCSTQPSTCLFSLSYVAQAARDPFFYLLHGNVDRLWARWQRANPQRHDSRPGATPYGLNSSNVNITRTMPPWDGSSNIRPWVRGSAELKTKTSLDPSVVSPPIYDTAPLTIPVLQAGQAVILQIPWYPPNPRQFPTGPASNQSFTLLARIETSTTAPFGMTRAEGSSIQTNVRNNNNIARRNVAVLAPAITLAGSPTARSLSSTTASAEPATVEILNDFDQLVMSSICTTPDSAPVVLSLPPDLRKRWEQGGAQGEGVRKINGGQLEIAPGGKLDGFALRPGEVFQVKAGTRDGVAELSQRGAPGDPGLMVLRTEVEAPGATASADFTERRPRENPHFIRPGTTLSVSAADFGDVSKVKSMKLLVDGREVASRKGPPFDFQWKGQKLGGHDLQLEATDRAGAVRTISRVVTVVENLSPEAQLIAPEDQASYPAGTKIAVQAQASDPDGRIVQVEFQLSNMSVFADPVTVATVAKPPYKTTIEGLTEGMWMLSAVAVDDAGVESQSTPAHFMVTPARKRP
jgi:hypothetical protein